MSELFLALGPGPPPTLTRIPGSALVTFIQSIDAAYNDIK